MEKRKPSYDLEAIKQAIGSRGVLPVTTVALNDAIALGFSRDDMRAILATMRTRMFVKSMTSHADHRIWQDVYHVPVDGLMLYVKFQADAVDEFRLMSFKER